MYVSLVHIPLTLLYNFCKATFKLNIAFYVYTKDIGALSFLFEVNCLLRIDRNVSLFGTLVLFSLLWYYCWWQKWVHVQTGVMLHVFDLRWLVDRIQLSHSYRKEIMSLVFKSLKNQDIPGKVWCSCIDMNYKLQNYIFVVDIKWFWLEIVYISILSHQCHTNV